MDIERAVSIRWRPIHGVRAPFGVMSWFGIMGLFKQRGRDVRLEADECALLWVYIPVEAGYLGPGWLLLSPIPGCLA